MGSKDKDDKFASYMTTFAKNRMEVAEVDDLPDTRDDIPVIDIRTQSALNNTLVVLTAKVAGAEEEDTVTIQLWRLLPGFPDAVGAWTLVSTTSALLGAEEVRFNNLLAARYQLVCSAVSLDSSWDFYESHTER